MNSLITITMMYIQINIHNSFKISTEFKHSQYNIINITKSTGFLTNEI